MEMENKKLSIVIETKQNSSGGMKNKKFWHIDKEILPMKIHYFFFVGGMGAVLPYTSPLAITKLGLTPGNLAAVYTTQQFLVLFFKPGIGYLADYFNRLKATIIGLTVLQAIFFFFMIMIPSPNSSQLGVLGKKNSVCQLCHNLQELENVSLKNAFVEDGLQNRAIECLEHSQLYNIKYNVTQCYNKDSGNGRHPNYRIIQATCNISQSIDCRITENCTTEDLAFAIDITLILQDFDSLQDVFLCFLPSSGETPLDKSSSLNETIRQCHKVSKSQLTQFQNLTHGTLFNTIDCQNFKPNLYASENDEHNAASSMENFKIYQFWLFALCLISACTCTSSMFTISDTACFESLRGRDYGRQRAWGAVSWGVIAPFAGFLNDYTGGYMVSWCLMAALCSIQIWNLSRMNLVKPDFSRNIIKDIRAVFSSVEFVAFEVGVFMNGVFTGILWSYLPWFVTDIGGNKLAVGLVNTVQCYLGIMPMMFLSGWLIKKMGHFNIVSLSLICYSIRFFIYSYLHNPFWILPVECLHGFTFASFYAAMTSYAKLNSKPGTEATTQAVLCATYEALGAGTGSVLSGICFDFYGGHTTFFYASLVCVVATIINVLLGIFIGCRKGIFNVTKKDVVSNERY